MMPTLSELPLFLILLAITSWVVQLAMKRLFLRLRFKTSDDAILCQLADDFRRPTAELLAEFGFLAPEFEKIEIYGRRVTLRGAKDIVLPRHQARQVLKLYQSVFGARHGWLSAWVLRQDKLTILLPQISRHAQIRALARGRANPSDLQFALSGALA